MRKKLVLILAVLLTSAAAISLILAFSRYVGVLTHPDSWSPVPGFKVEPAVWESQGLRVVVAPVGGGGASGVSALLVSAFWAFEVRVQNGAKAPVDVDFDQVTLALGGQNERALPSQMALQLLNERMTGAYASGAARRGYQEALDQLEGRMSGVVRVFPGYTRTSLVLFQPHPEVPGRAGIALRGLRWVDGGDVPPVMFGLRRTG